MIKSFRHKGLQRFFELGVTSGIQAAHAQRIRVQLAALNAAHGISDLNTATGWRIHPLKGDMKGYFAMSVSGNWRMTFRFVGVDVELVDYLDYH
jgi:toxin HigB-1